MNNKEKKQQRDTAQHQKDTAKYQKETVKAETIWNKDFVILFIVNIIAFLGFQMLNPLMTKYAANIGVESSILGLVTGAYAFAALLSRPFGGYLTDRLNKKLFMIFSLLGMSLCFLGYIFVKSPELLIALRFLHGIFFGLDSTVAMTMASNALPSSKLSSGLGFFSISSVASMAIAPSIGIWILDLSGYPSLFLISAVLTLISLVLALGISKESQRGSGYRRSICLHNLFSVEALGPAVICVLVSSTSGLCSSFMVLFGDNRGISNVGLYFTVYALTLVLVRPAVGRIADRTPSIYIGIPCCFSIIAAMVTLWYAKNLIHILLAGILFGIGYSILPLLQSMCIKCVTPERRGVASSTYYMGLDIGNAAGPVVGGLLSAAVGYGNTFLLFCLPIIGGVAILLFLNQKSAKEPDFTGNTDNT